MIEALEPNCHTFIPVRLSRSGRILIGLDHFFLYVGQVLDAVVIEKTSFVEGYGRAGFVRSPIFSHLRDEVVLGGEMIRNHHLWRGGTGILGGGGDPFCLYTFCSDELASALKARGLDGWRYRECLVE